MIEKDPGKRQEVGNGTQAEVATIPILEEQLFVDKREVESGRLNISIDVEERTETVVQELARDDLEIERVKRNERVTELPHVRLEGDVTVIPVVEEVLVVEKALMLVEELRVRRRSSVERKEIPVVLRSERASVEHEAVAPLVGTGTGVVQCPER